MAKGSEFERAISKELSLWWTDDESKDMFWRTSNSGGRATVNRSTSGCGDIGPVDEVGAPLMKFTTIELKRGYNDAILMPILDSRQTQPKLLKFMGQAQRQAEQAGTPYWWLITKRDRCVPLVTMPKACVLRFAVHSGVAGFPHLRLSTPEMKGVVVMGWNNFLNWAIPEFIKEEYS